MAIDSKLKRMSILNLEGTDTLLPEPDGVIGEDDRRMLLGLYARSTAEDQVSSQPPPAVPDTPPLDVVEYH